MCVYVWGEGGFLSFSSEIPDKSFKCKCLNSGLIKTQVNYLRSIFTLVNASISQRFFCCYFLAQLEFAKRCQIFIIKMLSLFCPDPNSWHGLYSRKRTFSRHNRRCQEWRVLQGSQEVSYKKPPQTFGDIDWLSKQNDLIKENTFFLLPRLSLSWKWIFVWESYVWGNRKVRRYVINN